MERTNRKPGYCYRCGGRVEPGEGSLWWLPGPDDGGDVVGRTPAGWQVTHLDSSVCDRVLAERQKQEQAAREERRKARQQQEEAERSALQRQQQEIEAMLAKIPDCVCAGYNWDHSVLTGEGERVSFVSLSVDENPALAGLSLRRSYWEKYTAFDGSTCYTHSFGNACVLHATRSVVERAWAQFPNPAHYTETGWIDRQYSPEALTEWLQEYGPEAPRVVEAREKRARGEETGFLSDQPCAGWECRAFRAGRIDLLIKEGVL